MTYRPILGCSPPPPPLTTGAPGIAIYLISPHTPLAPFPRNNKSPRSFSFFHLLFLLFFSGEMLHATRAALTYTSNSFLLTPISHFFFYFSFSKMRFLSFSWCHIWSRTDNIYCDLAILIRYCRPPPPHMLAKHNAYPCFACIVRGGDWRLFLRTRRTHLSKHERLTGSEPTVRPFLNGNI